MAYENIRQVVANALSNKLYEQSRRGKASILGQELSNQLLSKQLDDLLPLQIEQLSKTIEFMISPEEKLQQALTMKQADSIIKQNEMKSEYDLRGWLAEQTAKARAQYPTKSIVEYQGMTGRGGRTAQTLEEEVSDYARTGMYSTDAIKSFYDKAKQTGERDYSLLGERYERPLSSSQMAPDILSEKERKATLEGLTKQMESMKEFSKYTSTWHNRDTEIRNILKDKNADPTLRALAEQYVYVKDAKDVTEALQRRGQMSTAETQATAPTNTLEDKIQMFMKANNITSRDEAVKILRSEGIIQ